MRGPGQDCNKQKHRREGSSLIIYKRLPFLLLSVFVLPFALFGWQKMECLAYSDQEKIVSIKNAGAEMFDEDPVMNFLGKGFAEIIQELGEPHEQGVSSWYGPHYYIAYTHKEGVIRFGSPEPEKKIAVSIILGPGKEVLGARVGMTFSEIQDILGPPAFGPELGMDNLYYMDYYLGEINHEMPEVFISFSAETMHSSTDDAFIKWEAYEYDYVKLM